MYSDTCFTHFMEIQIKEKYEISNFVIFFWWNNHIYIFDFQFDFNLYNNEGFFKSQRWKKSVCKVFVIEIHLWKKNVVVLIVIVDRCYVDLMSYKI